MTTWLTDDKGNKCSVEYFGSKEAAQKALDSLENCTNCTNCQDCKNCRYCSYCSYCSFKEETKGIEKRVEIPKIENIHQKIYEAVSQPSALNMRSWHSCDTTHCRAGWVVTLAGEDGEALEKFHGTCLAASLIYRESSPLAVSPIRFFDNDKDAMEDMKKMAELEAA